VDTYGKKLVYRDKPLSPSKKDEYNKKSKAKLDSLEKGLLNLKVSLNEKSKKRGGRRRKSNKHKTRKYRANRK